MKIAFLYSFEKSDWKSCEVITANLIKTYSFVFDKKDTSHFSYDSSMGDYEKLKLAEKIFEYNPTHIIIVDHKPHPLKIFKFLDHFYSQNKIKERAEYIIHVFGDFTLNAKDWQDSEDYLKKHSVKFVCASDRQKDLVSKFFKDKKKEVFKCPFPVDTDSFYFSPEIRKNVRSELGIKENEIIFLYTGRMSLQKKIFELTFDFAQFLKITNADAYLYFAGAYDDIGNPYIGAESRPGEFCQRHLLLLAGLDENVRSRIRYVGNLSATELLKYYNMADCYISLSAHNDEDFGMSPAEAICTGLPTILSDWAGYASFDLDGKNSCVLVPMKIESKTGVSYNSKFLIKQLILKLNTFKDDRNNRESLMKLNSNAFSIKANIKTVTNILKSDSQKFSGFSELMERFSLAFENERSPFATYKHTYEVIYSDLYKEAYGSYVRR